MTGNFPSTSALHIFASPALIFSQLATPLMSFSIGLVSPRCPPVFTRFTNPTASRYMNAAPCSSTLASSWMQLGLRSSAFPIS